MCKKLYFISYKKLLFLINLYLYNIFLGLIIFYLSWATAQHLAVTLDCYLYGLIGVGTTVYYSYLKQKKSNVWIRVILLIAGASIYGLYSYEIYPNYIEIIVGLTALILYKPVRYMIFIKNILIAFVWTYISYYMVAKQIEYSLILERFVWVYLLCFLLDFSQREQDLQIKHRTLSNVLSLKQNLNLIFALIVIVFYLQYSLYSLNLASVILIYNLLIISILYFKKPTTQAYLIIDLSILFYALCL